MRRLVIAVAAAALLVTASPAWAKGPTGVTIDGSGEAEPVVVEGYGERGGGTDLAALVEAAGFWQLVFGMGPVPGEPGRALDARPTGDLGAAITLTWHLGGVDLPARLYPFAPGGPVVTMPSGLVVTAFDTETTGGWFAADPKLLELLDAFGVSPAATSQPPAPGPVTVRPAAAEPSGAPAASEPTAIPDHSPAGAIGFAAAAVVMVAGAALWAMRGRPRRIAAP